jgi:hypothetical protein
MKKFFLIAATAGFFVSCANKKTSQQPVQNTNTADTITSVSFFPVTSFLKGQMLLFDSMDINPLHVTTTHEKTDSQWLKKGEIKQLLQPFLSPEINDTNLTKYFKESKFNDQTLDAITFTYDPITTLPDSINLLTWNVYVNPEKGNVTKIYIVKHTIEDGKNIVQQLTWQTGKQAEITNIFNKPDGSADILKQEKFIWDLDK